jgi:hypothetical protein
MKTNFFPPAAIAAISLLLTACDGGQSPEGPPPAEPVINGPMPELSITAEPDKLRLNERYLLSWQSEAAETCVAEGDWDGEQALQGQLELVAEDTGLRRHILRCRGDGGERLEEARVMVLAPMEPDALSEPERDTGPVDPPADAEPLPLTLSVSPERAGAGDEITLSWSSAEGGTCMADGDWSGARDVEGEVVLSLSEDREYLYRLVCVGFGGHERAEVRVSPPED